MLIVNAVVNKLLEVFAPYLNKKIKKKFLINKESSEIEKQAHALEQYDVIRQTYLNKHKINKLHHSNVYFRNALII